MHCNAQNTQRREAMHRLKNSKTQNVLEKPTSIQYNRMHIRVWKTVTQETTCVSRNLVFKAPEAKKY